MKLKVTKDWCVNMACNEIGSEVSAGPISGDVFFSKKPVLENTNEGSRIALGIFINLMRRKSTLSVEELAAKARIDIGEVLSIEEDANYVPDVRTLFRLSKVFNVSQKKLMGLSGLTKPKDVTYIDETVKYAARSESVEVLNSEEEAALDAIIKVLSER